MDSHTQSIYQIFDTGVSIEVPFFQRSYVWGMEEWKKFLSDMADLCNQNKPYFLGAIILKRLSKEEKRKSIVDGQQRLTTLLILLKILSFQDSELTFEYLSHFRNKKNGNKEIKFKHSYYDREAFEKVVLLDKLEDLTGDNHIIEAYNYFRANVAAYNLDYDKIVDKVSLVDIEIDADEDEQQIFETINSVGRKLTTGELLKNFIFMDSAIDKYKEIWVPAFEKDEECISYWDSIITAGRTKRSNTESFFHAFLQIKMQSSEYNVSPEEKAIFRKADSVFNNYKTFIGKYITDIIPFAKEIASYAKIYKESFEVDCTHRHITAEPSIDRINFIIYSFDATTLIPYVLYVLKNAQEEEIKKIFAFLETYIVRRTICKESNDNYSDMFNEYLIAKDIKTYEGLKDYIDSKGKTTMLMPNDEMVTNAFHNVALPDNRAKGILYLLESKVRSVKHSTCLAECCKYDLEHLMPKKWETHWQNLPKGYTEDDRNKALKTLGNLMIISDSLNRSISNADWTTKKNGKGNHPGLLKYASDLEIWNGALELPVWNEKSIADRANRLAEQANDVWFNECNEDVASPKNGQDDTLFSLDGENFMKKAKFVPLLVKKYLEKNPSLTLAQLKEKFPDKLLGGYKVLGFIVAAQTLKESDMPERKKQKCYYIKDDSYRLVSGDEIPFFVNNQWTIESISAVIKIAENDGWCITRKSSKTHSK